MNDDITAVLDSGGLDPPSNGTNRKYPRSRNEIIFDTTTKYISFRKENPIHRSKIEAELISLINSEIDLENELLEKGKKHRRLVDLPHAVIAKLLVELDGVVNITFTDDVTSQSFLFAAYVEEGSEKGIYRTDAEYIEALAKDYDFCMGEKKMKDVFSELRKYSPKVHPCKDPNLVAVNNGIFDFKAKKLLPFSPDMVFTKKSRVDYVVGATNPTLHNDDDNTDWDFDTWLSELSDDPEVVNLLWELLGAIIRPNVRWDKAVFLVGADGCNGKGTFCELLRALCGEGCYTPLKIKDFEKEFMLEPLIWSMAVIADENDVGSSYMEHAANFKCAVTGDKMLLNRKFKTPVTFVFSGLVVECLNELSFRLKDKSNSFYRRQLLVPFEKTFLKTDRKYIKQDYMHDKRVLEYILFKTLNMNFSKLSEPQVSLKLLDDFKVANDPVRQFLDEMLPQFTWDLLPYRFLYDLYREWMRINCPSGSPESKLTFTKNVNSLLKNDAVWEPRYNQAITTGRKMDAPEPLIARYQLKDWYNPLYHGTDPDKIGNPDLRVSYKGIRRR